jgi:hypothetical protein
VGRLCVCCGGGICLCVEVEYMSQYSKREACEEVARQVEFYMSEANLCRPDDYFQNKLKIDPFIPLTDFLNCNRIKRLTQSTNTLVKAVEKFSKGKLVLNDEKSKIARADFQTFDVQKLIDQHPPGKMLICNLPLDSTLHSVHKDLLPNAYVDFREISSRKFILPIAFVEFPFDDDVDAFIDKGKVLELPFPGEDENFDKFRIYALHSYALELECID